MFAEAFHSTIKGIHLALEVKTSFDNSKPVMGSSMESSTRKPGLPIDSRYRHHQKEEKGNLHTKSYKSKVKRLRSVRLIHDDQKITTRYVIALSKVKGLISLLAPIK
jgi:hypothetical protein